MGYPPKSRGGLGRSGVRGRAPDGSTDPAKVWPVELIGQGMDLYRKAYAITTATVDAVDGHYAWCVAQLTR